MRRTFILLNLLGAWALSTIVSAEEEAHVIEIHRAAGPITVDGDLSDPGWEGAAEVSTWYETNPGDNIPPRVRNLAWVTYDDHYFYAGFKFQDPRPASIRAPYAD